MGKKMTSRARIGKTWLTVAQEIVCPLPVRADGFRLPSSFGKQKSDFISVYSVALW